MLWLLERYSLCILTMTSEICSFIVYIRDFLGHESIETTQIYAKANPESRRQALETVNRKLPTPDMNDWNDDPELTSFLNGL